MYQKDLIKEFLRDLTFELHDMGLIPTSLLSFRWDKKELVESKTRKRLEKDKTLLVHS